MILEVIPDSLYILPNIKTLMSNNRSSILRKVLNESLLDKEMYLSTVAILIVIKGKQVISNYDGQKMTIEEGQMVYLSKDIYLVSDFVTTNGIFEAFIFFMDDSFLEKYLLFSIGDATPVRENTTKENLTTLQADVQIKKYINALMQVYKNTDKTFTLVEIKLMELLQLIKSRDGGDIFLSSVLSLKPAKERRNIKDFMQKNYLKNLKVEDYALLTGRSLSSFIRDFKRFYNTTPNQWLIQQRLLKAHDLLTTTHLNVTETALEVGYENISHFIRAYKKQFGHTPKISKKL